jgi:hypothetical protein
MLEMANLDFIQLITSGIPILELERRLKPQEGSVVAYLGEEESLIDVTRSDWEVVIGYGTTHQDIAQALRKAINGTAELNPRYELEMFEGSVGPQVCPWECGEEYENSGIYGIIHPKGIGETTIEKHKLRLGDGTMGPGNPAGLATVTDFHHHLISKHYFFEGRESLYRADPDVLINALVQ